MKYEDKPKYTYQEIEKIMEDNKIIQPPINSIEEYNGYVEHMIKLKDSEEITDCCWMSVLMDALIEYEYANPEQFDFEDDEDDQPVFYEGKKVEIKYKGLEETE